MSQINNNNKTQEQAKKSNAKLVLDSIEFPRLLETAISDTDTFSELINNVFSPAFPQYFGSRIEVVANNRNICTTIFFSDDGQHTDEEMGYSEQGPFKAITPILTSENNRSAISRMKAYNFIHNNSGSTRPKTFKLTEDGKSLLSEFIPSQAINQKNGKINWDAITLEQSFNDGFAHTTTVFGVRIDFTKLIRRVYNDDKHTKYSYQVMIGNPVNNNLMSAGGVVLSNNWQMFVLRVDPDDVVNLARKYGYGTSNNLGIVMV